MRLIGRRNFLSCMGLGVGANLLGSMFSSWLPEALGAPLPSRRRFVLITHGGGLPERHYTCVSRSDTDFDLSPVLTPFAPLKRDLMVLSKFYCPFDKRLHGNQYAVLSMQKSPNQKFSDFHGKPPGGISVDRYLARNIGLRDAFDSTVVAVQENGVPVHLSADGPGQEYPGIGTPVKAFEAYFGAGITGPSGTTAEKMLSEQKSLLDLIRGDIARMQARLAGPERVKLEQYLDSLRGVERQLSELTRANQCDRSSRPPDELDRGALDQNVIAAFIAVTFAAQQCGLTRVSHVSIHGYSSPHVPYKWLGDRGGFHVDHHKNREEILVTIETYISSVVADMAGRFAAVPEGNGTMLDNSLVVFINVCGGAHHNGHDNYSVITLGKAGAGLRTGRYLSYPQGQHSLGDVWCGIVNAMGVTAATFGDPLFCKGPLDAFSV